MTYQIEVTENGMMRAVVFWGKKPTKTDLKGIQAKYPGCDLRVRLG